MFLVSAVETSFLNLIYHRAGTVVYLLLLKFSMDGGISLPIDDFLMDSELEKAICIIIAKQHAMSSFGAQARAGVKPLESTAVTEQPLPSRFSVTLTMPLGADMCRGLVLYRMKRTFN